jgi:hypothetical protein
VDIFDITRSSQILIKPDASQTVDIEVRLGNDWVDKLPPEPEIQTQQQQQ